eukprot:IDg2737t1
MGTSACCRRGASVSGRASSWPVDAHIRARRSEHVHARAGSLPVGAGARPKSRT